MPFHDAGRDGRHRMPVARKRSGRGLAALAARGLRRAASTSPRLRVGAGGARWPYSDDGAPLSATLGAESSTGEGGRSDDRSRGANQKRRSGATAGSEALWSVAVWVRPRSAGSDGRAPRCRVFGLPTYIPESVVGAVACLHDEQQVPGFHVRPRCGHDLLDHTVHLGGHRELHLHRLDGEQQVALRHLIALGYR